MNVKTFITDRLGVDKAIFYTLLSRSLQIFTALFTIFFIAGNLSLEEQGYYYTFGSIVGIQVFFELGLTGIITQFVAHEKSNLQFDDNYNLLGNVLYKSRLSSLLHFCAKWYAVFAILLLVALIIAGYIFFTRFENHVSDIEWLSPWVLLAIGTSFNLLIAPLIAFVEGLGKVKEMAQIRVIQQIIQPIAVWGGLLIGCKLYVSGVDAILRVVIVGFLLWKSPFRVMIKNIWRDLASDRIAYMKEVFPYQWRIALSWISGYFIFQLFNPVLFAAEGSQIAGQMGMTISALSGIQALSQAWINTKVPKMSGYIAQKEYSKLDILFNSTFKQLLLIGTSLLVLFTITIYVIQILQLQIGGLDISERFLPIIPLILMVWAIWTTLPVNCWATYLRCHKKEPLLLNSVIMGIACCLSTLLLGYQYGLYGMVIGYSCLRIISLIWVYTVFEKNKQLWHNIES